MILELDCGNSFIKWRILDNNTTVIARGSEEDPQQLFNELTQYKHHISFCRLVSVRSKQATSTLIDLLKSHYDITIKQAISASISHGVKNGYDDYQRLGADRWSAIVAAYDTCKTNVLIISFGTAITCDYINASGEHLGGFITPGLSLMRRQLLSNTGRIQYNKHIENNPSDSLGTCTEDAIDNGCYLMIQGFVKQQLILAKQHLGEDFNLFVSGGDAKYFDIPNATYSPDLVFNGLALLCPLTDD